MEWTLALKAHDQPAWFGHFRGVIFDDVRSFQGLADFEWGYFTLEHALDRVGTVKNLGHGLIIHWELLMSLRDGHLHFPSKQSPDYQEAASTEKHRLAATYEKEC